MGSLAEQHHQNKVRLAIIGLGRIASLLEDDTKREKPASHAGAFAAIDSCSIVAGCDTDEVRRSAFAERWQVTTVFSDAEAMLAAIHPDIVVIATYPDTHAEFSLLAAAYNVPVVVCEKPLTDSLAKSRALVKAFGRSSSVLMVNHERRYARDYGRVKAIIDDGRYGNLSSIFGKLYMGRGRTPGEVLVWDGTHMIDILRFLCSSEAESIATGGHPEEKNGSLFVRFTIKKAIVVLEIACNRDHLVFELDLGFEGGRVRIGNGLYEEWVGDESPYYDKMRSLVPVPVDKSALEPTGYFARMAEDAVRVFRTKNTVPSSAGVDGLRALETIERILKKSGSSLKRISRIGA